MPEPALNFDIDRYINPFVPYSRLHLLPTPISWFLGYRSRPIPRIGSVLVWWWSFFGGFAAILVIEAVFHTQAIRDHGSPIVIASLGAAAILEYNTIESPLAQPRNAILGQVFSAIIGVGVTKLFHLNSNFENIRWIAGALAVGLSSAFMGFTKTVHPPAGATALLAATTPEITELGWFLVPLILLGSVLLIAVGCVTNNIQRKFPEYWWTAANLNRPKAEDIERQPDSKETEVREASTSEKEFTDERPHIMVNDERILVPEWLSLSEEETEVLEILRSKLQRGLINARSSETDETQVKGTGS